MGYSKTMTAHISSPPARQAIWRHLPPAFRILLAMTLAALGFSPAGIAVRAGEAPALVACASSMRFAMDELASAFRASSGGEMRIAYGSSGNFARQIMQGAPFELFVAADSIYAGRIAEAGLALDAGKAYAQGRLALFVPKGSPLKPDASLSDLGKAIADGRLKRFAIASPEHAPYGQAAREALESAGLWDKIGPYLVLGENVAQAAQFASAGSAQGGIIAYSLALAPDMARRGNFVLLPGGSHRPLRHLAVLTRRAGATARAFYDFLTTEPARAIMARHGFGSPQGAD